MQLRKYLTENISKTLNGINKVGLLFSGGTDSSLILFSLLDLGVEPHLYIYTVEGYTSNDYSKAIMVRDKFGLQLTNCVIPNDIDILIEDVRTLIRYGIKGQVAIQCMHGNLYIRKKFTEKLGYNGSGVDGLYGTYRDMAILRNKPTEFFKKQSKHLNNPNDDGMLYLKRLYEQYTIRIEFPYRQYNIANDLLGRSYNEMNRPRNKWIMVKEYQDYYNKLPKYYNPRGSQQLMAGTKQLHQRLLNTPLNMKNRKNTIWLYKDIAERIKNEK